MTSDIRLQNGALSTTQVGTYNVYTGARYVPLIAGEWDLTKNYEPLTIVINQGNSYTSAQYVPAGVPLQNNGPYWFLTGNFNGQISDIYSRLNSLMPNNRKVLLLGDSFGEGYVENIGIASEYGWAYYINNYLNNFYINVKSGAGFIGQGGPTYSSMLDDITQTDVFDIYIQTAGNDYAQTYPNQVNAINSFVNKAMEKFPYLNNIYIIYNVNSGSALLGKSNDIINNIKNSPNISSKIIIADNFQSLLHNLKYYNPEDGFHLSKIGAEFLALSIAYFVKNKTFPYEKKLCSLYNSTSGLDIIQNENGLLINSSSPWIPGEYANGYYIFRQLNYGDDCPIIQGNYTIGTVQIVKNWNVIQSGILIVNGNTLRIATAEINDITNIHSLFCIYYPFNDLAF